ncbi:MAG TPA: lytic transglycosylase, partial [Afipia sp.]|nr:lytic transglycosylase [Afipia sp.]
MKWRHPGKWLAVGVIVTLTATLARADEPDDPP